MAVGRAHEATNVWEKSARGAAPRAVSTPSGTLGELFPAVYEEVRRLARFHLRRERRADSLQPTALTHEVYLRLAGQKGGRYSRAQLLALAARMMRRVLVDHARRRWAGKRGLALLAAFPDDAAGPPACPPVDLLDLERALDELARLDERQGRIVELRFFGGLSVEETAEVTGLSRATVKREWHTARLFLHHALATTDVVR